MIIDFKASDLTTFEGRFDGHLIQILKQSNGDWSLYVDFVPVKDSRRSSARGCMDLAEKAANNILAAKVKKGAN